MTDHSTRRAAFLAAVRDAFDEHFPRPRPEEWEGNHFAEPGKSYVVAEAAKRLEEGAVTLPEYAVITPNGDMAVLLSDGDTVVFLASCSDSDLDRIAAACTAWAAIKRREGDDA